MTAGEFCQDCGDLVPGTDVTDRCDECRARVGLPPRGDGVHKHYAAEPDPSYSRSLRQPWQVRAWLTGETPWIIAKGLTEAEALACLRALRELAGSDPGGAPKRGARTSNPEARVRNIVRHALDELRDAGAAKGEDAAFRLSIAARVAKLLVDLGLVASPGPRPAREDPMEAFGSGGPAEEARRDERARQHPGYLGSAAAAWDRAAVLGLRTRYADTKKLQLADVKMLIGFALSGEGLLASAVSRDVEELLMGSGWERVLPTRNG